MQVMTRDDARKLFAESGIDRLAITNKDLARLRALINARMKSSGLLSGQFRCRQRFVIDQLPGQLRAFLKCKAHYFDDREAVSFNRDGFIGFAGWADDRNIQPILTGFVDWVCELRQGSKR